MPIYEYECQACAHRFERFVRPSSRPVEEILACPSCHSHDLQRLLSSFAVNSEGTKQLHLAQARTLTDRIQRDKRHAETEDMVNHRH